MPDFPRNPVVPPFIHSYMRWMSGFALRTAAGSVAVPSGSAWGTANTAVYIPLVLPWSYVVKRMFWFNGVSAGGNSDIGLYSPGGGNLWSAGSTADTGNSVPQYVTPATPIVLSPGLYYVAFTHSDTTASRLLATTITTPAGRMIGALQQATALPLPASAAFAAFTGTVYPLVGITNTASGF